MKKLTAAEVATINAAQRKSIREIDPDDTRIQTIVAKRGPKGDKGDTGNDGPIGVRGSVGPEGKPGPVGPKGNDGPVGPVGAKGNDGVGPDEKVRVSVNDPSAGFLADKLQAGNNVLIRRNKRGDALVIDSLSPSGGGGGRSSSGGSSGINVYDDGTAVGQGNKVSFDGGDPVTVSGGIIHVPVGSGGGGGTDDQTAAEVPFTPAGTIAATDTQAAVEEVATDAASALSTHAGAADPHPGYTTAAELSTAIAGKADTASAVMDGDAAGGVLAGTFPSPSFAADMATQAELDAHTADASDAHDASAVSIVPFGTIAATNVQTALEEIVAEAGGGAVDSVNGQTGVVVLDAGDVEVDPTVAGGSNVQAALEGLATGLIPDPGNSWAELTEVAVGYRIVSDGTHVWQVNTAGTTAEKDPEDEFNFDVNGLSDREYSTIIESSGVVWCYVGEVGEAPTQPAEFSGIFGTEDAANNIIRYNKAITGDGNVYHEIGARSLAVGNAVVSLTSVTEIGFSEIQNTAFVNDPGVGDYAEGQWGVATPGFVAGWQAHAEVAEAYADFDDGAGIGPNGTPATVGMGLHADADGHPRWTFPTFTVRTAAGVPSGVPTGTELPFAFDTTAITGGFYYWNGSAWVKVATIL